MAHLNTQEQWTAACHHEAAHCTVAILHGLPITDVALGWERRGLLGRVPSGLVRIPDRITDPAPLALVAAGGALAEARWVHHAHNTPMDSAYEVAARRNADDANALDTYLRDGQLDHQAVLDEALCLVDSEWGLVEVLAVAISAAGYLTGQQLRRLARIA